MTSYTLDDRDEALIEDLIQAGHYKSVNEVVRAGLQLVDEREKSDPMELAELRAAVQEGLDSGPAIEITDIEAFFEDVKARGRQRLAAQLAK